MKYLGQKIDRDLFEVAAMLAMNGLLSDHVDMEEERKTGETCPECVARLSCEYADALVSELNRSCISPSQS